MQTILGVGLYLAAINLATFQTFRHDKRASEIGGWRVAESTLLLMAAVGGTLGAFTARRVLRHKTRKQPFVTQLFLVACLQGVGLTAVLLLPI